MKKEDEQKQLGKGCIGCLGTVMILVVVFLVIFNLAGSNKTNKKETGITSTSTINPADYDSLILTTLQKNFKDIADVSFSSDNKIFTLTPVSEDFKTSIAAMQTGAITNEAWDEMVSKITNLSEKIKEKYGEGYTLNIANPANPENTLLMIKDGIVAYDFSEEINQ